MKYIIIQLATILTLSLSAFSQLGNVEGFISDANSQTPVLGASINIGTGNGDNSDMFGKFTIPSITPGQYEMIVSHIGYKTEIIAIEVKPNTLSSVEIKLRKSELDLTEVKIKSKKNKGINTISGIDIRLRPINNSQDVLRIVPGLFIAQHAGGGKAEQIFLRGFDIDHGTDIAINVDGIPVNMVSHAHGQGYADLHFLIPETVEKVDFDKGPYFADKGNLATAAYVDFSTKDQLESNTIKTEIGLFNTQRVVGLLKVFTKNTETTRQQMYLASEYSSTDGYFNSPQNFHRFNIMGKYNIWVGKKAQLTIAASTFDSKWNASGQIPERAIQNGSLSRFGAIDDTEGGNTSRTNISFKFKKQWKNNWKTSDLLYYSKYKFNLFSNFTFFLEDSINGDMIRQSESRDIFGYTTTASHNYQIGNKKASIEFGGGFRYDNIKDIELAKESRIKFFNSIRKGDIKELNSFIYLDQDIALSDKININTGIRFDHFSFNYNDKTIENGTFQQQKKGIFSPKLNISYSPNQTLKIYLNNGIGFHSNDTRVIIQQNADKILPKVFGTDLGLIIKPGKSLILKAAIWRLISEQEFVYVGDAGIVEPSGRSRRIGIDLSARYQFTKWLFGDIDLNLTKARSIDQPKNENYIPLAPLFTSIGGLTANLKNGFSGSLRYRFIDTRPANESNTVKADGYLLGDIILKYRIKQFDFSISCENIFNSNWKEAQFETESRLKNEIDPISEIHFTPGSPRFLKAGVSFHF